MGKSVLRRLEIQLEAAQEKLRNIIDDAENGVNNDELYYEQDLIVNKLKERVNNEISRTKN